jgi:hypothetical protein
MRHLFRLVPLLALVLVLLPAVARPARADDWCWADPTLVINGKTVHLDTGAPLPKKELIRASTVVVTVPVNVDAHLTGVNAPNFPMTVQLVRAGVWSGVGAVPVTATGVVDAPSDVPTAFKTWQSNTGATVQTQAWGGQTMTLSFTVQ